MGFTIRELELLSGIKAHTIRIWEQRYSFLKPSRTTTNIRTYTNEELKTLLTVALLNKHGFKISRIDQMPPTQRSNALLELPDPDASGERLANELLGFMIDLDALSFEELLNRYIRNFGMEKAIMQVIFQFLKKVGILWQTNRILPVQEHIVSGIIRQKIISAIEGLNHEPRSRPLFVLFLPEDEHHEMGLLFVHYLLRKKNVSVLYLGASLPLTDLEYVVRMKAPDYLYLHLTSFPHQHNLRRYLSQLEKARGGASLLLSGTVAQSLLKKPLPARTVVFSSLEAVVSHISGLH